MLVKCKDWSGTTEVPEQWERVGFLQREATQPRLEAKPILQVAWTQALFSNHFILALHGPWCNEPNG